MIVLAFLASLLIYAFDASLSQLIQLYVVGVFTSFTLSQAGMVRHWLKVRRRGTKEARGWQRSLLINAVGALATATVLIVVVETKFVHGAWIVIAAMPVIIAGFYAIHRHYMTVERQRDRGGESFSEPGANIVVLQVQRLDAATAEAIGYIRSFAGNDFRAIHVRNGTTTDQVVRDWKAFSRTDADLVVVPGARGTVSAVIDYVRSIPRRPNDFVNVVIPEVLPKRSLVAALRTSAFLLKLRLLKEPQAVITDVPVLEVHGQPQGVDARPLIPGRLEAILFVSSVHDGVIRAVNFARSLRPTDIRAVHFAFDPGAVGDIIDEWGRHRIPIPLEIAEATFRDLTSPILEEVARSTAGMGSVAAVIIPELVPSRWWHRLLHNQRAVFIKRLLLFEPRVVLSSVPYQLRQGTLPAPAGPERDPVKREFHTAAP
ncbi:MAG: hypothetical protein H0W94_04370 [Actinobacteria bacterium]|nr:hypothetical protein [Actinomycetota bacterium]